MPPKEDTSKKSKADAGKKGDKGKDKGKKDHKVEEKKEPEVKEPEGPPKPQPFIRKVRRVVPKPPIVPPPPPPKEAPLPKKKLDKDKEKYGDLPNRLKAIREHQLFKDTINKFWSLLQISPLNRIQRSELRKLLHRIHKLLRPRYNESSIDQEISYTLAYYAGNNDSVDFELFTKILFDIAHIWCPNVILAEYIEFLHAVYRRIVTVIIHSPKEKPKECKAKITVKFPEEEKRVNSQLGEGEIQWTACKMDEIEQEDWEYTFKVDPKDPGKYDKLKRPKPQGKKPGLKIQVGLVVEEIYETIFDAEFNDISRTEEKLAETDTILPLGYISELYLVQAANKVEEKKSEFNAMLTDEIIIKNCIKQGQKNDLKTIPISVVGPEKAKSLITCFAELGSIVEQAIFQQLLVSKEHAVLVKPGEKFDWNIKDAKLSTDLDLKISYSLGLRRRLVLEQLKLDGKNLEWVNINYALEQHELQRMIESKISLKSDTSHLVLTDEEKGKQGDKQNKVKNEENLREAPYLNDIDYPKFLQIVLGNKQNAIKKELKNLLAAKSAEEKKEIPQDSKPENKFLDPLYKLTSNKEIQKDPYTSEFNIIEYAKQEVFF